MAHTLLRRMIYGAVLGWCAVLTTCFGADGPETTGISIFDTLFIANNTSLSIHGNVYLNQAHVLGKGNLVVQGESQSKIISDHSEVNNLEIITHGILRLEGELRVNHSLSVQSGILDLSAGKLHVSDSTKVRLLNGAVLQGDTRIADLPRQSGKHPSVNFAAKAILTNFYKADKLSTSTMQQQYLPVTQHKWQVSKDVASVPPERNMVSQGVLFNSKNIYS
ncbi:hypothetical protein SAMN04487995_5948 [Dyadobacter koreensis]|uniref:Polymer-forming protein n=1 Tax=Dyadobacter koreensis TaxID=408657 RepID=A0A1H7AUU9_9BACT|nr:hypothetical protein [Dyadobacter koreensis]SEJ69058.1 hypothetical protein SAMN04487995_5948 [Dyadobacter koreensis]